MELDQPCSNSYLLFTHDVFSTDEWEAGQDF